MIQVVSSNTTAQPYANHQNDWMKSTYSRNMYTFLDFNKCLEQHQNHGGLASSRWQEKAPITAALSFLLFNVNSRWQDLQEVQGWEWDATL